MKTTLINVGRCPTCHAFLIAEDLVHHDCKTPFQGTREIFIDHYYETHRNKDGHKTVVAKGHDGYFYRLIICKHNPPHGTKRKFTDEDTNHERNRTRVNIRRIFNVERSAILESVSSVK